MTLWIVLTVMISVASAILAVALTRRHDARDDRPGEAAALRAELADLDAQVAAGVLPRGTAEGLRAETIRRFIGPGAAGASRRAAPLSRRAQMALAVVLSAGVALGAALIYARLGQPRLAAGPAPAEAPAAAPSDQTAQVADLIPQLEAKVRAHPDATGLRLLGGAYMGVGRYADAAQAFARLVRMAPQDVDARSGEGEALARAADGRVTPDAAAAFRAALALDPTDPRARYFLALSKDQAGDHAGAMNDWIALIRSAPPGAPWAVQVRAFVEKSAADRHEDISGRLPPAPDAAPSTAPAAQAAMIAGMVGRLEARLAANPKDVDGWIMLVRARTVMGQGDAAAAAYRRAMAVFAGDEAARARISQAARSLGVATGS